MISVITIARCYCQLVANNPVIRQPITLINIVVPRDHGPCPIGLLAILCLEKKRVHKSMDSLIVDAIEVARHQEIYSLARH
jgi:hypothetical protein